MVNGYFKIIPELFKVNLDNAGSIQNDFTLLDCTISYAHLPRSKYPFTQWDLPVRKYVCNGIANVSSRYKLAVP